MSEEISDEEAYMLGLQVLGTPGGLDELERLTIENLRRAKAGLAQGLRENTKDHFLTPAQKSQCEYMLQQIQEKLQELGVDMREES